MPSSRPPQLRRRVIVVASVVLGLLALLVGPASLAGAYPYAATWPDPVVMEINGNDNAAYCIYAEGTLD